MQGNKNYRYAFVMLSFVLGAPTAVTAGLLGVGSSCPAGTSPHPTADRHACYACPSGTVAAQDATQGKLCEGNPSLGPCKEVAGSTYVEAENACIACEANYVLTEDNTCQPR